MTAIAKCIYQGMMLSCCCYNFSNDRLLGTYIQFTEEAAEILSDITQDADENSSMYLYFYRGNSDDSFSIYQYQAL